MSRASSEHVLDRPDGARLLYRVWPAAKGRPKGGLVLFHRGHEHSGRWQETVDALDLPDLQVFAWDARGHGGSTGERGTAESFETLTGDADAFVRHVSKEHGIPMADMVVLGHSVGAVIVAGWVHDFAPPVRGMVLATPAFRVKLYVPLAVPALRLKEKLLPGGFVRSYVKAAMLTHDPEEARRYAEDPQVFPQIAVNVLLGLHDAGERLAADSGAITVPALVLSASDDWVVSHAEQERFFTGLSSKVKRFQLLPGFHHAVFHEKDRALVVENVRAFVRELFTHPPEPVSLLDADREGYTKDEYDRLLRPGGPQWDAMRAVLQTAGRLSNGISLGWKAGFDSGVMLDYVYANQARGTTPIGELIDRVYLDGPGWAGIRQRKLDLEKLLEKAIRETHAAGRAVHVLDIATGGGRYVLETLARLDEVPATAVLRDYKEENLEAARSLSRELDLTDRVRIEHGDAFDADSLARLKPRPTIAIASGIYELFPQNEPVRRSLSGIAAAVAPGGRLIYTNQPWHPQLELIARTLTNREGQPWVMRRRTQAEMDQLVAAAGFTKAAQETGPGGVFTVSLAVRDGKPAAAASRRRAPRRASGKR